jgi:hypothetical protein
MPLYDLLIIVGQDNTITIRTEDEKPPATPRAGGFSFSLPKPRSSRLSAPLSLSAKCDIL